MQQEQQNAGPLFGIIIIVLVLVLGGLYYAGNRPSDKAEQTPEEILANPDSQLESLATQQSSDDVESIEKDLTATDLGTIDAELGVIQGEL